MDHQKSKQITGSLKDLNNYSLDTSDCPFKRLIFVSKQISFLKLSLTITYDYTIRFTTYDYSKRFTVELTLHFTVLYILP